MPSLLAEMPVGVEVGTLVHRVFESLDFAADDLSAALTEAITAAQARRRVELGDVDVVVAGLRAAIETPLGGRRRAAGHRRAPTGSTSSTSSFPWSAATTRAARR